MIYAHSIAKYNNSKYDMHMATYAHRKFTNDRRYDIQLSRVILKEIGE